MTTNGLTLEKINSQRLDRLEEKIDRILSQVGQAKGTTDFKLIGVFVSLLAMVGGLLFQGLSQNTQTIERIATRLEQHTDLVYHPGVLKLVNDLERTVNLKVNTLERVVSEKVVEAFKSQSAIQVSLANDIATLNAQILSASAKAEVQTDQINRLSLWRERTQETMGIQDAAQWERFRSIENNLKTPTTE